jgi:hypothetical protein
MSPVRAPRIDVGSVVVMAVTCALFAVALVAKGLTHDILLEAGMFLVSVKLMIMAYKNGAATARLQDSLEEMMAAIHRLGAPDERDRSTPEPGADATRRAAP